MKPLLYFILPFFLAAQGATGKVTGLRLNEYERSIFEQAAKKNDQKLSDWMRTTLVNAASLELNTPAP